MAETKSGIFQLANVALHVADQEKALQFYADALGFEVRLDAPFGPGMRWLEVAPPGAVTTIAILADPSSMAGADTGIRLNTTSADDDHARLKTLGVDVDPEVMRWPGVPPMFSLRDLDGNTLYIVEKS